MAISKVQMERIAQLLGLTPGVEDVKLTKKELEQALEVVLGHPDDSKTSQFRALHEDKR